MQKYLLILMISFISVDCEVTTNSSKMLTNENAPNATKMIVLEFVNGMGRALQQLLTANTMNIISTNKKSEEVPSGNSTLNSNNYQIEGEKLREDIIKRVNQLQTVLGTAIQVSKERRDGMANRILEQANIRLENAKDRADQILREPANSEIAVRTLRTINNGISQLNTFINTVLSRVNISINVDVKDKNQNIKDKI